MLLLINLIISLVLFFIISDKITLLNYINSLFYLCLLYLVVVLVIYTIKGGFFDGITYSFRRFHAVMFNPGDLLEEWKEKPLPSERFKESGYHALKFQCIVLFVLLLVLLGLYYII